MDILDGLGKLVDLGLVGFVLLWFMFRMERRIDNLIKLVEKLLYASMDRH